MDDGVRLNNLRRFGDNEVFIDNRDDGGQTSSAGEA